MKVKVRFRDGVTGGVLTTEHSQSSYGLPVFVPDDYTRDYMPADAYGPADLIENSPLVLAQTEIEDHELESIRNAGFRFAANWDEMQNI